jgi:hypothetical protein
MKMKRTHNSPGIYTKFTNIKVKTKTNKQKEFYTSSNENGNGSVLVVSASSLTKKWVLGMKLRGIVYLN